MEPVFVPVVWSLIAGACFTLGTVYLLAWLNEVGEREHLAFFVVAMSLGTLSLFELGIMRAATPQEAGTLIRWAHVPTATAVLSIVAFLHFYFGSRRLWLGYAACALRLAALVLNFHFEPNLNYASISHVRWITIFGEPASVPVGEPNPWMALGWLSSLALLLFALDAAYNGWRRGTTIERRRAVLIGGSLVIWVVVAAGYSALVTSGVIRFVFLFSLPSALVMAAMAFELGADTVRALQVTARLKQSEADLRRSEQRMHQVADSAQLGIWEWDMQADTIWATDQARALFGLGPSTPLSLERFVLTLHTADQDSVRRAANRLRDQGGTFEQSYRVSLPAGQSRWLLTRGRTEPDARGRPQLLRGVSFDITDRKLAEDRYQHERAYLRQVIDTMPGLIFAKDRQGRFTLANKALADLYAHPVDQLIGKSDADVNPHAEEVRQFRSTDLEVMDTQKQRFIAEEQITGADGKARWFMTIKVPIIDDSGACDQVLGSSIDITARKKAELEVEQQRNELAHLSRVTMLSELSGSLTHELNQPLAAILSNAQAALRFLDMTEPNMDEVREILRDIVSDDRRAGEVIRGLRLMLKRGELRQEPFDANELVRDVLKLVRGDILNAGVALTVDLAPTLPLLSGDRVQLQQVLLNLIVNGCEAMAVVAPRQRRLHVSTLLSDGQGVRVGVADQGAGIPGQDLERVFEPFFTTKPQGLGLGLSVCRRIIAAHGGRLWADSNSGGGASFFFTLPDHRPATGAHA